MPVPWCRGAPADDFIARREISTSLLSAGTASAAHRLAVPDLNTLAVAISNPPPNVYTSSIHKLASLGTLLNSAVSVRVAQHPAGSR